MTSERWEQIKGIYQAASERPAEERMVFVHDKCSGDAELLGEVQSLLGWSERGERMFAKPAAEIGPLLYEEPMPERIGAWRVLREVGRGGMGTVYLGRRDDGLFDQQVAIKLLHIGAGSRGALQRFKIERRILATLDHPNIARILDGGTLPSGRPYLVMEYVEGEPLDEFCRKRELKNEERLRLFLQVCDAVRYAHRNLVVHRDLKPANILVSSEGTPKLLDFGVAKLLEEGSAEGVATTDLLLTPAYASPEQVRGDAAMVASDIYSLGVVLYELLAQVRPYDVRATSPVAMVRAICDAEPPPPSSVAPPASRKALAGDLDNIILLAMRKDPERRYASVESMAADIRSHLEGRPVSARRDSTRYRAVKFILRHPVAVPVSALAVIAVITGVAAAFWQAHIARQRAEDGHRLARTVLFEIYDSVASLPGATATKDLVAKRAVEYLDKLARESKDNIELERDLAKGYMRVGEVEGTSGVANLGHVSEAMASYRKAIDLLERILQKSPLDAQALGSLATAHVDLSEEIDSVPDALAMARKAVLLAKQFAALQPQQPSGKQVLAKANYALARALTNSGQREETLPFYFDTLSAYQELSSADPANRDYRRAIALTHKRIGAIRWTLNQLPHALNHYQQATAIDEKLVQSSPSDMHAKLDLSYDYSDMGNLQNTMGNPQGLQTMLQALQLRHQVFSADPQDARACFSLVSLLQRVAHVEHQTGDLRSAIVHVNEGRTLMRQFAAKNHLGAAALFDLAGIESEWGEILAGRHSCAEAKGHLDEAYRILRELEARNALGAHNDLLQEVRENFGTCAMTP